MRFTAEDGDIIFPDNSPNALQLFSGQLEVAQPAQVESSPAPVIRRLAIGTVAGIAVTAAASPAFASDVTDVIRPSVSIPSSAALELTPPIDDTSTPSTKSVKPVTRLILSSSMPTIDEPIKADLTDKIAPVSTVSALQSEIPQVTIELTSVVDQIAPPPAPIRFAARVLRTALSPLEAIPVVSAPVEAVAGSITDVIKPPRPVPFAVQKLVAAENNTPKTSHTPVVITRPQEAILFVPRISEPEQQNTKPAHGNRTIIRSRKAILHELQTKHPDNSGELTNADLAPIGDKFGEHKLHKDVVPSFLELNAAFKARFGHGLKVNSSYRDIEDQKRVKGERGRFAAVPGTSKHGWGLAVDLGDLGGFDGTKYKWLREHGPKYGWDNPEKLRDGKGIDESWHFEYIGVPKKEASNDQNTQPANEQPATDTSDITPIQIVTVSPTTQEAPTDETGNNDSAAPSSAGENEQPQQQSEPDTSVDNNQTAPQQPEAPTPIVTLDSVDPSDTADADPNAEKQDSSNDKEQGSQTAEKDTSDQDSKDTEAAAPPKDENNGSRQQEESRAESKNTGEYSKEVLLQAAANLQKRGGLWTNRAKTMRFFIDKDLEPIHVAAITGNFMVESNDSDPNTDINPRASQEPGGPGRGIAQWSVGERWAEHKKFCRERGLSIWSLNAQHQFAYYEMKRGNMIDKLKQTKTIEGATYRFERLFERAGTPHYDKRYEAAREVHRALMEEARKIQDGRQ